MRNFFEPDDEHDSQDMRNVPQYAIERYASQVEEILMLFDLQEFFVSDETQICDFNLTPQELETYNYKLKSKHGIEITEDQYVWEIAAQIYDSQF